jgi:hypothetical protein
LRSTIALYSTRSQSFIVFSFAGRIRNNHPLRTMRIPFVWVCHCLAVEYTGEHSVPVDVNTIEMVERFRGATSLHLD